VTTSSQRDYYEFMAYSSEGLLLRYEPYAAWFEPGSTVLDVGCGRGEFLDLLARRGVRGVGVDADPDMVAAATESEFVAHRADAFEFLGDHEDAYDGVFAAHLIEHLPAGRMVDLVQAMARALRPGGRLLLVTPNPHNLSMHLNEFWTDLQHVRFYTPEIVRWVVHEAGLRDITIGENPLYQSGPTIDTTPLSPVAVPVAAHDSASSTTLRDKVRTRMVPPSMRGRVGHLQQQTETLAQELQRTKDAVIRLTEIVAGFFPPAEFFVTGIR